MPSRKDESQYELTYQMLSDVKRTEPKYLWSERIPVGKLTLLIGNPRGCLAQKIACEICAEVSVKEKKSVPQHACLYFSCENSYGDTLRPFVEEYGGDLNHIYAAQEIIGGRKPREFVLKEHLILRQWVEKLEAKHGTGYVNLVVFDPMMAYTVNCEPKGRQVRSELMPILRLAAEKEFAVLGLGYFSKSDTDKTTGNWGGSSMFTEMADTIWHVLPAKTRKGYSLRNVKKRT